MNNQPRIELFETLKYAVAHLLWEVTRWRARGSHGTHVGHVLGHDGCRRGGHGLTHGGSDHVTRPIQHGAHVRRGGVRRHGVRHGRSRVGRHWVWHGWGGVGRHGMRHRGLRHLRIESPRISRGGGSASVGLGVVRWETLSPTRVFLFSFSSLLLKVHQK